MATNPHQDAALDEALAATFPASDPPSQTVPVTATGPQHAPAGIPARARTRRISSDQPGGKHDPPPGTEADLH